MNSKEIFQMAVQLPKPWYVQEIGFKETSIGRLELHIQIGYSKGYVFALKKEIGVILIFSSTRVIFIVKFPESKQKLVK